MGLNPPLSYSNEDQTSEYPWVIDIVRSAVFGSGEVAGGSQESCDIFPR